MVEIERVSSQSLDIEEVNKEKLKSVFPECFAEGKLDIDKLLNLCGEYIDNDFEKYKFEWKGKSECYKIAGKRSTGTLRPCKEESVNFDTTNNLYIEGDNLEVLKLLQTAYYRKVKMIYIDPPYNTGSDFVYEDDFKDPIAKYKEVTQQTTKSNPETMGRYHTNWLNMMYPRLRLASNLLRDDGVIFISIDDNEVHNLRKLCDEVFGEENFVAQIIIQNNPRGRNLDRWVAKTHEYLVIYCKHYEEENTMKGIPKNDKMLQEYNYEDARGRYRILGLRNRNQSFNPITRPNLYFPLYVNTTTLKVSTIQNNVYTDEVFPDTPDGIQTCWTWSKKKIEEENHLVTAQKVGNEWRIFRKDYLLDENGEIAKTLVKSIWSENDMNNDYGRKALKELLGTSVMDFPKPIELIKRSIMTGTDKNDIVLDFFSGSTTTAHAVMQLNAEDGGNRRFICVQLPELCDEKSEAYKAGYKNICEIGKERIRRAGKKIAEQNSSVDVGFKVFKLDTSNLIKWDSTPTEDVEELQKRLALLNETIKPERNELDVVYEAMLKLGIKLDIPVKEVNINDKKAYLIEDNNAYTIICLDYGSDGINADDMKAMCEEYKPTRIVASEQAFKDDIALSNAHYILKDHNIEMKLL